MGNGNAVTAGGTFGSVGRLLALAAVLASGSGAAIQRCELDGKPVNVNNGGETAGRSGLIRCRDADTGQVQREYELKNGVSMGIVRGFKDGQVEREHSVNEKGNRDGPSREWNVDGGRRVLVREETLRDGQTTGVAKTWYANGQRRRLTSYGADDRERASVDFNDDGTLNGLRCTKQPVFGADFDDKAACGFGGSPSTVVTYGGRGVATFRITFDRGERIKTENLWANGTVRNLRETTATGGVERTFAEDGTKRHEVQWVNVKTSGDGPPARVNVVDQEFHESGRLIRERRWVPNERTVDPVSETTWYLNGQPKTRVQYVGAADKQVRRETAYYDNGTPASEGSWTITAARFARSELPAGTHKSFDAQGRVRGERVYDDRGRLSREREFDERGGLVRDDELFEDGSRKAMAR